LGQRAEILGSGTIAAIVTSLGGGPAAVGIVRLSGPNAIAVAGRVFRPVKRPKEEIGTVAWRPRSHFVEYGYVLDKDGNVIDEVMYLILHPSLFFYFCAKFSFSIINSVTLILVHVKLAKGLENFKWITTI
jgi:GTP-binding protein TrmE N-terminus